MKTRGCKILGFKNLYAEPRGRGRFVIKEYGTKTYTWTKPVTRAQALRVIGIDIPETCK